MDYLGGFYENGIQKNLLRFGLYFFFHFFTHPFSGVFQVKKFYFIRLLVKVAFDLQFIHIFTLLTPVEMADKMTHPSNHTQNN